MSLFEVLITNASRFYEKFDYSIMGKWRKKSDFLYLGLGPNFPRQRCSFLLKKINFTKSTEEFHSNWIYQNATGREQVYEAK